MPELKCAAPRLRAGICACVFRGKGICMRAFTLVYVWIVNVCLCASVSLYGKDLLKKFKERWMISGFWTQQVKYF